MSVVTLIMGPMLVRLRSIAIMIQVIGIGISAPDLLFFGAATISCSSTDVRANMTTQYGLVA